MTAAQLARLAELAAFAAGFFSTTDPEAARMFGDAARRAEVLSPELRRDEELSRPNSGATRNAPAIAPRCRVISASWRTG